MTKKEVMRKRKREIIKEMGKWVKFRFWNDITHRFGSVFRKRPLICKGCGKEIKRGKIGKYSYSFDLYHPHCMKRPLMKMIVMDEAGKVSNKQWEAIKQWEKKLK